MNEEARKYIEDLRENFEEKCNGRKHYIRN